MKIVWGLAGRASQVPRLCQNPRSARIAAGRWFGSVSPITGLCGQGVLGVGGVRVEGHEPAHPRPGRPGSEGAGLGALVAADVDGSEVAVGLWGVLEAAVGEELRHVAVRLGGEVLVADELDIEAFSEGFEILVALDPDALPLVWVTVGVEVTPVEELAGDDIAGIADDAEESDIPAEVSVSQEQVEPSAREDEAGGFVEEDRAAVLGDAVPELEDLGLGLWSAGGEEWASGGPPFCEALGAPVEGLAGEVPEIGFPEVEGLVGVGDADGGVVPESPVDGGGSGAFEAEEDDGPWALHASGYRPAVAKRWSGPGWGRGRGLPTTTAPDWSGAVGVCEDVSRVPTVAA